MSGVGPGNNQGHHLPNPAGMGARFAAWLIDSVLCALPAVLTYFVTVYLTFRSAWFFDGASFIQVLGHGSEFVFEFPDEYYYVWLIPLILWLILAVTVSALGGARGQTLGRKIMGIRLVSSAIGAPLGAGMALVRGAFFNVVPFMGAVSVVMIIADSNGRRGLHDRVVNAGVVAANFDPAQTRVAYATAPHTGARFPTQHPADAPAQGTVNPHDTQLMNSPLMRNLDAPPPATAPPAPLPAWLDRSPSAGYQAPVQRPPAPQAPKVPEVPQPEVSHPAQPLVPEAPQPQVPDAPAQQAPSAIDDEVEMTRLVKPGQARREYRPSAPEPVQARVRVSDGQVVDIRGTTLVGRNPAPREGERAVTLLSVKDPERSVSKTHLILGLDARGLWAADRTSTNGSVVTLADGQQIVCMPEQQVRVMPGAKIQIGNVVITVLPV